MQISFPACRAAPLRSLAGPALGMAGLCACGAPEGTRAIGVLLGLAGLLLARRRPRRRTPSGRCSGAAREAPRVWADLSESGWLCWRAADAVRLLACSGAGRAGAWGLSLTGRRAGAGSLTFPARGLPARELRRIARLQLHPHRAGRASRG